MLFDIVTVIVNVTGILVWSFILTAVTVNTLAGGGVFAWTWTMTVTEKKQRESSSSPAPLIEEASASVVEAKKQQ